MLEKSDHDQLLELMAKYANALDFKRYDAITDCFAETASIDYAGFTEPVTGAASITAYIRSAIEPLDVSQHVFGNFIVDIDGNAAVLTCDVIAQHIGNGAHNGDALQAGGKYRVRAVKEQGTWRFSAIQARSLWSQGNRHLLPKTA